MPILNGTTYSDSQLLDILGEFPRAFEIMKGRGVPCDLSKLRASEVPVPPPRISNTNGNGLVKFDWLEAPNGRLTSKPVLRGGQHREIFKDVEFVYPLCLELVVAASLSDDQAFVDAYLAREDLHQRTADRLGVSRDMAKRIIFSGSLGRAVEGGSPLSHVWPEVFEARRRFIEQAESDGIVRTLFSRRALTRDMCVSGDFLGRSWNHYVLGTAADLMKIGLVLAHRRGIPVCGVFIDEFVVEAGHGPAMREVLDQLPIRFLNSPVTIAGPKTALSRICGEDVI